MLARLSTKLIDLRLVQRDSTLEKEMQRRRKKCYRRRTESAFAAEMGDDELTAAMNVTLATAAESRLLPVRRDQQEVGVARCLFIISFFFYLRIPHPFIAQSPLPRSISHARTHNCQGAA